MQGVSMDVKKIRKDFPFLKQDIVYFDNAATSQKPKQVLDELMHFYTDSNANVHRGVYDLAEQATKLYEQARARIASFINAQPEEIIFTRGTTESINLVASAWGKAHIQAGDEIVVTHLEHHSNFVPWQQLTQELGAKLVIIPVNFDGTLHVEMIHKLVTNKTKLIAASSTSNALGVHNDMKVLADAAQSVGALFLIDAAQSIGHQRTDVQKLRCDFLAFSGHKMLGPTGIGVLYMKKKVQAKVPPYQFGGGMIYEARNETSSFLPAPHKYEAGTPPIAQAIGLAAAIDYLQTINFDALQKHEAQLCAKLIDGLSAFERITILGPVDELKTNGHMVSFIVDSMHAHDVAAYLSTQGICVRAGHHCAQPLARQLGIESSVRVSFYLYNTHEEVERLLQAIAKLF